MMRLPDIIELRERRESFRRDYLEYQARRARMTTGGRLRCRISVWLGRQFIALGQHMQAGAASALSAASASRLEGSL